MSHFLGVERDGISSGLYDPRCGYSGEDAPRGGHSGEDSDDDPEDSSFTRFSVCLSNLGIFLM